VWLFKTLLPRRFLAHNSSKSGAKSVQVNSENPLVSVVIPVKDRPKELKRAVLSALAQTYKNIEVIVVENNSKNRESVRSVVESFGERALHVYHLAPCANTNVARNFGVSKANGSLVAFLDSDDEYESQHIATCVDAMRQKICDFIYGSIKVYDGQNHKIKMARDLGSSETGLDYFFGRNRSWAQTSTYVCRKTIFHKLMWDEKLRRHQDFDFFVRVVIDFHSGCNSEASVIVHWKKGEKRDIDFKSYELFARKWIPCMSIYSALFFSAFKVKTCLAERQGNSLCFFLRLLSVRLLSRRRVDADSNKKNLCP
jgi:glycosyltransferase involved in cell wall biosynthesis